MCPPSKTVLVVDSRLELRLGFEDEALHRHPLLVLGLDVISLRLLSFFEVEEDHANEEIEEEERPDQNEEHEVEGGVGAALPSTQRNVDVD